MIDPGKSATIEILRREVGFGCPICRSPFLTWHHFDPPYEIEHHWRPEGIIALCPRCHGTADKKGSGPGAYSVSELRAMKAANWPAEDVRGHFPEWQGKRSALVRVGGCYMDTSGPLISINGVPQIAIRKNEKGLLSLSFELRDSQERVLAKMEDNWLTAYPQNIHDMIVTPKSTEITVWLAKEDIGLKFIFRRVSMTELEDILARDRKKGETEALAMRERMLLELPTEQQSIARERFQNRQPPAWLNDMPEDLRDAYLAKDKTGFSVKKWVAENCSMDDGLVPFLDFDQMSIYHHGERFLIRDGVADFVHYSHLFAGAKGGINVGCGCTVCCQQTQKSM